MNKNRIIIILFLLVGIIGFASQAQAATLTQITATPSDVTAGNTTIYTIAFNTATTILNTGKITIEFPAGFDVSGASFDSWTGFDGGQTLTVTTQTITITRDGLGTSSIAGAKTIVLGNIINTAVTANNYQITVTTKNAADTTLDGPTGTIYFQIFSSHSETDINGIYYLRDDAQTHYQNRGGSGTGIDIGTLSRTAPISDGYRYCVAWVQFYFDENGTYTQTNQITNIYYHIWWVTNSSQGMLGYNKTGDYGGAINESFTVNTVNSPNKVGYYLYTGKQTFASSQSILGNAIYNFGVIFSGIYPNIISYPNQSSFIIINLPDDATLQSLDSDSDGLTDYDELFPVAPTPPTNPHKADTDNDNWEDKYEIDNNLNPIDPDQAPTLGKWFIKQYDGGTANDYFGWFVSSISDIDGDGKDDVLVGVPYADPGGRTDAGSAYIYSSGIAGTLLKQYDGGAAADYLGYSVSSISDIDGDGKDDVLVGVPSADFSGGLTDAGSAYIYSSGTIGTLLKQYNGRAAADYLGYSVSSISDIDGDGKDDVLVGARYADPGGRTNAGSAYIYSSGTAGTLFKQYDGGAANDNFGYSVSSIS
ncbi:MAG: integrin alpha, partial [Candidatus Omnitrophica bacterium]|nr:integrin alpha [Candidatus Omnitrophota bacterium]